MAFNCLIIQCCRRREPPKKRGKNGNENSKLFVRVLYYLHVIRKSVHRDFHMLNSRCGTNRTRDVLTRKKRWTKIWCTYVYLCIDFFLIARYFGLLSTLCMYIMYDIICTISCVLSWQTVLGTRTVSLRRKCAPDLEETTTITENTICRQKSVHYRHVRFYNIYFHEIRIIFFHVRGTCANRSKMRLNCWHACLFGTKMEIEEQNRNVLCRTRRGSAYFPHRRV